LKPAVPAQSFEHFVRAAGWVPLLARCDRSLHRPASIEPAGYLDSLAHVLQDFRGIFTEDASTSRHSLGKLPLSGDTFALHAVDVQAVAAAPAVPPPFPPPMFLAKFRFQEEIFGRKKNIVLRGSLPTETRVPKAVLHNHLKLQGAGHAKKSSGQREQDLPTP
jgi:hypothetical protein